MAAEGLDWPNLDAVWISHFHLDHIGGLAPFLFGTRHAAETSERSKPLVIFGGQGLKRLFRRMDQAGNFKLMQQPFPLEIREVAPRTEFEILPGLAARTFSTMHTRESLAIRLTDQNQASLAYTSDTGYTEALGRFAQGAQLFLMECSFWRNKPLETHLELADAMRLARLAEPLRVVLTHLYPEWDEVDIPRQAARLWSGETIAATDGLRLTIENKS
jgi:ribonuclease BN (tRNA processing enzyme)